MKTPDEQIADLQAAVIRTQATIDTLIKVRQMVREEYWLAWWRYERDRLLAEGLDADLVDQAIRLAQQGASRAMVGAPAALQ